MNYSGLIPEIEEGVRLLPPHFLKTHLSKEEREEQLADRKPCLENEDLWPTSIRMCDWWSWHGPACDDETFLAFQNILGVETRRMTQVDLKILPVRELPVRERINRPAELSSQDVPIERILLKFVYPEICIEEDDEILDTVVEQLKQRFQMKGRLSPDLVWQIAHSMLMSKTKDVLSTASLSDVLFGLSYLFSSRVFSITVNHQEEGGFDITKEVHSSCRYLVEQALSHEPDKRKAALKRSLEESTLYGQPLAKRIKLAVEDKYVCVSKLALDQPAIGVVSEGRLSLTQTSGDVKSHYVILPWPRDGGFTDKIPIYVGEEELEGHWKSPKGKVVYLSVSRKGGRKLSEQEILSLQFNGTYMDLNPHERENLLLDIMWYTRCHYVFTLSFSQEKGTPKESFQFQARSLSEETRKFHLIERLGPLIDQPGVNPDLEWKMTKTLAKIKIENFETTSRRVDNSLWADERLNVYQGKGKRKIMDFEPIDEVPAKRPAVLITPINREIETCLKALAQCIYQITGEELKRWASGDLATPSQRALLNANMSCSDKYHSGGNRRVSALLTLQNQTLSKLLAFKLMLCLGPLPDTVKWMKTQKWTLATPSFTWFRKLYKYSEEVPNLSMENSLFSLCGQLVQPELPISLKDAYLFMNIELHDPLIKTMDVETVKQLKPIEAVIFIGNRRLRITKRPEEIPPLEQTVGKHKDNAGFLSAEVELEEGSSTDEDGYSD